MSSLRAVAAAVYGGNDALRLTTSIVEAERKEDIVLRETETTFFRPHSSSDVRNVFTGLTEKIDRLVREQKQEIAMTVPVVFGWPAQFASEDLVKNIGKAFELPTKEKLKNPKTFFPKPLVGEAPIIERTASRSRHLMTIVAELFEERLQKHFQHGKTDCELHPRGFLDLEVGFPNTSVEYLTDQLLSRQGNERQQKILALVESTKQGDAKAKEELNEALRTQARSFADTCRRMNLFDNSTRFFMTGLRKPPFTEDVHLNCFAFIEGSREVFAKELIQVLGLRQNICLKAPIDSVNPPFTDVAATLVADGLDAQAGRSDPTCVMVNRRLDGANAKTLS